MTKENSTEIVFVVDRSGSMSGIAADMIGGFKTFIEDQKKTPGECKVTLARFDEEYELVFEGKALTEVPDLELVPRGMTALLDAIGRTVDATGARLAKTPEADRPSKVLFVVITDGEENSSREYSQERVSRMIKTQREKYSWDFVFLGADENAIKTAKAYNIQHAVAYNAVAGAAAQGVMQGLSHQVSSYRSAKGSAGTGAALQGMQAAYNASAGGDQAALDALKKIAEDADKGTHGS